MRLLRCWLLSLVAAVLTTLTLVVLVSRRDGGGGGGGGQPGSKEHTHHHQQQLLLPKCSGRAPCIGFGTPYFDDWLGWAPYVNQWHAGSQETCGHACDVVADPTQADAVLFHGRDLHRMSAQLARTPRQHWVYMNMESPLAAKFYGYDVASNAARFRYLFNWTATTMLSSSVHLPYGIWQQRAQPLDGPFYSPAKKRHLAYVAFSNCKESFNHRTEKVAQLSRHIDVHVYGRCGDRPLAKDWNVWRQISEQYRFYLSFENAMCKDYITEKFHNNGLDSQAVPVVFGGLGRSDYDAVAPPNSFVYALDFPSMRALADHLKALAADEERYAGYFRWKRYYQVSPRGALLCGVCARLHKDRSPGVFDLSHFYDVGRNCRASDYSYLP